MSRYDSQNSDKARIKLSGMWEKSKELPKLSNATTEKEIIARIDDYFNSCDMGDAILCEAGLSLAIGYSNRGSLRRAAGWQNATDQGGNRHQEIMGKALLVVINGLTDRADAMGIFNLKQFGFEDETSGVTEIVVRHVKADKVGKES